MYYTVFVDTIIPKGLITFANILKQHLHWKHQ